MRKQKNIIFSIIIFLIFILVYETQKIGFTIINIMAGICVALVFYTLHYFFIEQKAKIINYKDYLLIVFLGIISMLPLMTQSYLYGDDYWLFYKGITSQNLYLTSASLRRPFLGVPASLFLGVDIESMHYFRTMTVCVLILFGCLMFKFLSEKLKNKKIAFLVAAFITAGCSTVDLVGYAAIFPMSFSLLISALSYVNYEKMVDLKREKKKKEFVFFLLINAVLLLSAFYFYQMGTTICFIMLALSLFETKEKKAQINHIFTYIINYAMVTIFYLISSKYIVSLIGGTLGQTNRSSINLSMEFIANKIQWFIVEVIPQTVNRIVGLFCGSTLFSTDSMFYWPHFSNATIGIIITIFILCVILRFLGEILLNKKQPILFLFLLTLMPLTFYPFLLLPESTYLTYYAFPLIVLLIIYFTLGIFYIYCDVKKVMCQKNTAANSKKSELLILFFVVIIAIQGNIYAQKFWVNYNVSAKEYIKINIKSQLNENTKNIYAIGRISTYVGGHEYVLFAINRILESMDLSTDNYNIVHTDNEFYSITLTDKEYSEFSDVLNEEEFELLNRCYVKNTMYSGYFLNIDFLTDDERIMLKEIFTKQGSIPILSEDDVFIDLSGYMSLYTFY